MTYAQVSDVEAAFEGPGRLLDSHSRVWVETQIGKAERLLLARRPSITRRVTAGELDRQNVVDAVVNAVLRVARNPGGIERENEGGYGIGLARDVAGGKLFFTGDDYALVDPPTATGSGFGSIVLGLPAHRRAHLGGS